MRGSSNHTRNVLKCDGNMWVWKPRHYRPQRSCGKVMFSQASVILLTGGVCQTPPGRHPLVRHTPPGSHPLGRPPSWADTPTPGQDTLPADGYCSGRYASYWNASLLHIISYRLCLYLPRINNFMHE